MQLANLCNRLSLIEEEWSVDVATVSNGRFSEDPQAVFDHWEEFKSWSQSISPKGHPNAFKYSPSDLCAPVPRPRQVFAIAKNYASSTAATPAPPLIFTKFPSSITGPCDPIRVTSDSVDWEVEAVVAIGYETSNASPSTAWKNAAGITVGQDISDRQLQWEAEPAQFSLGKSCPTFAPIGPVLVSADKYTPDKLGNLQLNTKLIDQNGHTTQVQDGCSEQMLYDIPTLISWLSSHVTLLPGDLIFTGSPGGTGQSMSPQRFLKKGETLVSTIEGIGSMRNPITQ